MPTKRLPLKKHKLVHEFAAAGLSFRQIMKKAKVSMGTVANYTKEPLPDDEVIEPVMPQSWAEDYLPFVVDGPCKVLILSDVHIPFHDQKALEVAVESGRQHGCNLVWLNGDALDFHRPARYPHDGSKITYNEEIRLGKQFLAWLREKFPKARIIFKEGNHEERLEKYILSRSEVLFGLPELTVPKLLRFAQFGIEHIGEQRVGHLGALRLIHGHEYGKGQNAPVNGARWLMLRARKSAVMGHLHHTSEQPETDIDGEVRTCWSIGCLCSLNPKYQRLSSKWNHGFAITDISKDGSFEFFNKRIRQGKVL